MPDVEKAKYVDIVMTDAPGATGQFVEVEDQDGRSIQVGKWLQRDDGYWALRISHLPPAPQENWNPNTSGPNCDWCGECEWCLNLGRASRLSPATTTEGDSDV